MALASWSAVTAEASRILLAFCVGLVIIGGIRRIGTATSFIVPVMCGVYIFAGLYILAANASAGRIFFSNQILQRSKITYFSGNFYASHQSINICFGGQIIWMDSWVIIWRGGSQRDPTCAFWAELQNRCGKR